jgi:hypothetical protein
MTLWPNRALFVFTLGGRHAAAESRRAAIAIIGVPPCGGASSRCQHHQGNPEPSCRALVPSEQRAHDDRKGRAGPPHQQMFSGSGALDFVACPGSPKR